MYVQPLSLFFCYGNDFVSTRIARWTFSLFSPSWLMLSPSHVAIACHFNGSILWVESTTLCHHPCLIRKKIVSGCQAHWPDYRVLDYVKNGGRVDLYSPSFVHKLDESSSKKLSDLLIYGFVERGVDYDLGSAIISGTRIYKNSNLYPWADLNKVFCSELAAKMLMVFGLLPLDNPAKYNPGDLARTVLRIGTMELVKRDVQPEDLYVS